MTYWHSKDQEWLNSRGYSKHELGSRPGTYRCHTPDGGLALVDVWTCRVMAKQAFRESNFADKWKKFRTESGLKPLEELRSSPRIRGKWKPKPK